MLGTYIWFGYVFLEERLRLIKDAGFDSICTGGATISLLAKEKKKTCKVVCRLWLKIEHAHLPTPARMPYGEVSGHELFEIHKEKLSMPPLWIRHSDYSSL